jgi:hypothetical protein
MTPFDFLSDDDRWQLGFHVVALDHTARHGARAEGFALRAGNGE